MTLAPATRLGRYEIISLLGVGGMGEVYRARDAALSRDVAIKVLPRSLASDADRVRRFDQEARAAGRLNHPNVLAVYDVGVHEETPYVVSELLQGQTLRERLRAGPVPVRKAIEYTVQVAHGLSAAHHVGIVHRDLKPENLFLTQDGLVKILDFGLAKLKHPHEFGTDRTQSPTAAAETEPGTILGTVGYMSPEQVRGQAADHRSDLFSLGAILYEMVSGRRAFRGDSAIDTLGAILNEDPPELSSSRGPVPPGLEQLIRRSLEKSPDDRLQSPQDLAFALGLLAEHSGLGTARHRPAASRRWWLPALAALAVIGVAVAVITILEPWRTAAPTFQRLTFRRGGIWSARFAPDGHTIVYGAAWEGNPIQVFATQPENPESRRLDLPAADIMAISSTGNAALLLDRQFASTMSLSGVGTLARAPLGGGAPRELLADVEYADWGPDGTLAVVRRTGGRARLEYPIGTVRYESPAGPAWISHPRVSSTGQWVAFIDHPNVDEAGAIVVVDRLGQTRRLSEGWFAVQGLAWLRDDREIWFTATAAGVDRAVHAVDLSGRRRLVLRVPGTLTLHDVSPRGRVLVTRDSFRAATSAMTPRGSRERDLSWFDFSILTNIADDGSKVLFSESGAGVGSKTVIYSRNTDGSPAVRFGEAFSATFSPDGKWLLARREDRKRLMLWPTGAGEARTVPQHRMDIYFWSTWFPDGRSIVFAGIEPGHGQRVYLQPLNGEAPRPLTPDGFSLYAQSSPVSHNGRTLVVRHPEGHAVLYSLDGQTSRPVPGLMPGDQPIRWTADGRMLLVFRPGLPARMYTVDVLTGRTDWWKEIMPADPAGVFAIGWMGATADGQTYAYSYMQLLSDLFLVDGLK